MTPLDWYFELSDLNANDVVIRDDFKIDEKEEERPVRLFSASGRAL
jgi:hypothetical protein